MTHDRHHRTGARSGFTIVELILSMGLMSIVMSVALPPLILVKDHFEARSASRRFVMAHSLTRATAIQRGGIAELRIDPTSNTFWVEVENSAVGADTVSFHSGFPNGLTLTSNRSRVCFDSRGLSTTRSGCEPADVDVRFTLGDFEQQVRTTVLGQLRR